MYSFDLLNHLILYDDKLPIYISYSNNELHSIQKITYDNTCILLYYSNNSNTYTVGEIRNILLVYDNSLVYATEKITWLDIDKIICDDQMIILYYNHPSINSTI
jgi:hypothetical protein